MVSPENAVAPVVVRPDTVSKTASVNEGWSDEIHRGSEPNRLIETHAEA